VLFPQIRSNLSERDPTQMLDVGKQKLLVASGWNTVHSTRRKTRRKTRKKVRRKMREKRSLPHESCYFLSLQVGGWSSRRGERGGERGGKRGASPGSPALLQEEDQSFGRRPPLCGRRGGGRGQRREPGEPLRYRRNLALQILSEQG
jgi:hypothetical protein